MFNAISFTTSSHVYVVVVNTGAKGNCKDHSRATKEQQNMYTIPIKENHHVYLLTC